MTSREKIITVFSQFYREKSISKITVTSIVKKCHINRSTFYRNFLDVYDIRDQLEKHLLATLKHSSQNTANDYSLDDLVPHFKRLIDNSPEIKILLAGPDRYHTAYGLALELMPFYQKEFKLKDDAQTRYQLIFYLAGLVTVLSEWEVSGEDLPAKQIGQVIEKIITKGFTDLMVKK